MSFPRAASLEDLGNPYRDPSYSEEYHGIPPYPANSLTNIHNSSIPQYYDVPLYQTNSLTNIHNSSVPGGASYLHNEFYRMSLHPHHATSLPHINNIPMIEPSRGTAFEEEIYDMRYHQATPQTYINNSGYGPESPEGAPFSEEISDTPYNLTTSLAYDANAECVSERAPFSADSENYETTDDEDEEFSDEDTEKQIMISCQRDCMELMQCIKNNLQQHTYKVWMHVAEMGDYTLQSISEAVDNSEVVLVAMSQKYEETPHCRTEAQYAYCTGKTIIPLLVEPMYQPDGWLAEVIGTEDYYDFSNPTTCESVFNELMEELGDRSKIVFGFSDFIDLADITHCWPGEETELDTPCGTTSRAEERASGAKPKLNSESKSAVKNESGDQNVHGNLGGNGSKLKHIMISYQWDHQDIAKQINEKLKEQNYRVWMDLDKMSGSILNAMADAVENSAVVLVCMSEKYMKSTNCTTEAEYAYKLKKNIVPLIVEPKYEPRGWLGALLGTKLYFDFSRKTAFDDVFQNLMKELGRKMKSEFTTSKTEPVSNWSQEQVERWVKANNIKLSSVANLEGDSLIELKRMNDQAPEFFTTMHQTN